MRRPGSTSTPASGPSTCIKPMVASTRRAEVLGGLGDFGGLFALDTSRYRQPVLVSGTDGVGTKAAVAQAVGRLRHGRDRPGGDVRRRPGVPGRGAAVLPRLHLDRQRRARPHGRPGVRGGRGLPAGRVPPCSGARWRSTPASWRPTSSTWSGFAVGVVERDEILGPQRVVAGDVLLGLPSPGLRSNGYTLARHVLLERAGAASPTPPGRAPTPRSPTSCCCPR